MTDPQKRETAKITPVTHTPGKLHCDEDRVSLLSEKGHYICNLYDADGDSFENMKANAARLVLCWNHHDALVEALEAQICSSCDNRLGWNGPHDAAQTRLGRGDWRDCEGCRESRDLLDAIRADKGSARE